MSDDLSESNVTSPPTSNGVTTTLTSPFSARGEERHMARRSQKSGLGPAMEQVASSAVIWKDAVSDNSLFEIVGDVFAVVTLNHDKKWSKEVTNAWVLNQVKRDLGIAGLAMPQTRSPEQLQAPSASKRIGPSSGTRISWCKVPQPNITAETTFVKRVANLVPIITMSMVEPLQRMNMWTSLPRNYGDPATDADEPINIPYFEDELFNQELIDVFSKDFQERSSLPKYTETENKIFYEAVQKLLDILEVKDWKGVRSKNSPNVPPDEVFVAINKHFPDYGNVQELKERFNYLLRMWHPRASELELVPASTPFPNMDDDSANTESYTRGAALHTFSRLFCRRCLIYDCLVHPDKEEFISSEFIAKRGKWLLPHASCGPVCYWNNKLEAGSSKRCQQNAAAWKPSDETMCRVLKDVFPGNICAISKIMLKSCEEVYEFILRDNPEAFVPSMTAVASYLAKQELPKRKVFTGSKGQKTGVVWGTLTPEDLAEMATVVYKPCGHPGMSCSEYENCPCKEARTPCEKFCSCAADCKHRFIGCRCESTCESKACPCLAASRECDPDLCSSCGCSDYDVNKLKCKNVSIQRMLKKKLKLAKSDIPNAGWGIFAGEPIFKNEFISEYVGELISAEEADRRAREYNARCHTYLFELNQDYAVDATRKGNKIRFANHSSNPNAMFKVMKVNTDHRIGIYATRNIEAGEEIFLNYENVLMEHGSVAEERKKKHKKTRKRRQPM